MVKPSMSSPSPFITKSVMLGDEMTGFNGPTEGLIISLCKRGQQEMKMGKE
jgi:hypothetical protein